MSGDGSVAERHVNRRKLNRFPAQMTRQVFLHTHPISRTIISPQGRGNCSFAHGAELTIFISRRFLISSRREIPQLPEIIG
jgi:hypothetical protein